MSTAKSKIVVLDKTTDNFRFEKNRYGNHNGNQTAGASPLRIGPDGNLQTTRQPTKTPGWP
jgi:hypothetical protein